MSKANICNMQVVAVSVSYENLRLRILDTDHDCIVLLLAGVGYYIWTLR